MKRRGFLQGLLVGGALAGRGWPRAFAADKNPYPFATLGEAMAAASFDPGDPSSFTVAWCADTHYGDGDPEQLLPPVFREIEAMAPPPAFLGIAGDLICKASLCFGQVPDEKQKEEALAEFRLLKEHLARLSPRIPVHLALGNHDTYPGEDDPALFHAVFPNLPEYHAFTVKGVRFIFLNGGSSGLMDGEQRAWLRARAREHHRPDGTLVLVVHQPSLGSLVAERGISAAYREALAECEGELWSVSGHGHTNNDACFRLPKAVITQAAITCANPRSHGREHPGYWIWCFSRGKVVARIFRRIGQGYKPAPAPPIERARPIALPFEGKEGILWKVLVGEGDEPYRMKTQAAWCLNYWHYNRQLIYRFPLAPAEGRARRLVVLETPCGPEPRRYFLSPDAEAWEEVTDVERDGVYTRLPIPKACLEAGTVAVRLEQCVVSGFALVP